MNPKGWQINMPKFAVPQPRSSSATPPVDLSASITSDRGTSVEQPPQQPQDGTDHSAAVGAGAMPSESGDLGETPLAHLQEESSTAGAVHQKQDKTNPKDPNSEQGVLEAEAVMAAVPGTQTQEESAAMKQEKEKKRESFMGVEWGKVFGKGSLTRQKSSRGDATPSGVDALEAKVPGVFDDLTDEERRGLDVDDGVAMESSTASLDGNGKAAAEPTGSGSQRKDLEAKIVREMVRELGNGKSHLAPPSVLCESNYRWLA